ncbi:ABC transporter permease [Vagococcus sp. JNUCC 83]
MKTFRRVWWNIANQKKKNVILFLLFFLISIVVITGISIKLVVEESSANAKKQIKAEVTLQTDLMTAQNAGKIEETPEFNASMVNKIKKMPEVKNVIVESKSYINSDYQMVMTEEEKKMMGNVQDAGMPDGYKQPTQYLFGVDNFNQIDSFNKGQASLIEGEAPYKSTKKNPVVISKKLAELNKLKIGDTYKINGGYSSSKPVDCTIVGLFDYLEPKKQTDSNAMNFVDPLEKKENKIYTTTKVAENTIKLDDPSKHQMTYDFIKIELTNSDKIDTIISKIKKEFNYNWTYTNFISDKDQISNMTASIDQLSNIANIVILLGTVATLIILFLFMLFSFKDRIFEFGLLSSLGASSFGIMMQTILESTFVLLISFSIAVGASQPIANTVGNQILSNTAEQAKENSTTNNNQINNGQMIVQPNMIQEEKKEPIDTISITTLKSNIILTSLGIIFSILLVSTCVPLLLLLRKDPKTILLRTE